VRARTQDFIGAAKVVVSNRAGRAISPRVWFRYVLRGRDDSPGAMLRLLRPARPGHDVAAVDAAWAKWPISRGNATQECSLLFHSGKKEASAVAPLLRNALSRAFPLQVAARK